MGAGYGRPADNFLMVSVPFTGGEVYGNTLVAGHIEEGEAYVLFTLRDPINVALSPRDFTRGAGVRRVRRYKEEDFRYVALPLREVKDKFGYKITKQEDIRIKHRSGNVSHLFVPASSILSIDVRDSYPSNWYIRRELYRFKLRKIVKRSMYLLGFIMASLQILFILNTWGCVTF